MLHGSFRKSFSTEVLRFGEEVDVKFWRWRKLKLNEILIFFLILDSIQTIDKDDHEDNINTIINSNGIIKNAVK